MSILGLIAGYLILLGAGLGISLLLLHPRRSLNLIEPACLALPLGVGAVSIALWLCGTFSSGLMLQAAVSIACIALTLLGWHATRRVGTKFSLPAPRNRLEWVLAVILIVEILTVLFVSLKHTLGWDGLLNWEIKARYAFLNGGAVPQSYYSDTGRAFSHSEYPLGIPLTEAWLYLWMGEVNQFWIKSIFPLFYIAGAFLLALLVTRCSGRRWLGLLVSVLLPFVPFIMGSPGGVIVGYVDFPLSVVYLVAVGYLLLSSSSESQSWKVYAAYLTLLLWLKSEGSILWGVMGLVGVGISLQRKRLREGLVALLPGLFLLFGWHAYLRVMHAVKPVDFFQPSWHLLHENLGRFGTILTLLWLEVTELNNWSIFWLIVAIALVSLLLRRDRSSLLLIAATVTPVALYSLAYVFSAWASYTAHMTSSFPRLLLQLVPVGWLAIGYALASPGKSEGRAWS